MTRPGIGLYGGAPFTDARPVVSLDLPVIQTRAVRAGEGVGYGYAWTAPRDCRIATVAVGYADGYLRCLGNRATAFAGATPLPLVGVVSMDTATFDVTGAPEVREGGWIELLGPNQSLDALATEAGTIGYEILTSLGGRYARVYADAQPERLIA